MSERNISVQYNEAVESYIALMRMLGDDEWAVPVDCTPGWTVRDVLSHVSGVPDDGLAGRVDGAATEPWTASQVERNAGFTVDELLDRWESQYELFGAAINDMGEGRPPYDCHSHEHDVRQALRRPGNRDSGIVLDGAEALLESLSGVPVAITVVYEDGSTVSAGQPDAGRSARLDTTKFEIFRSRLGRRTVEQVRSLDWTADDDVLDVVIDGWFAFGPSEISIDE